MASPPGPPQEPGDGRWPRSRAAVAVRRTGRRVLEPEVLPPPGDAARGEAPPRAGAGPWTSGSDPGRRMRRVLSPVFAGALLDLVDFFTLGPVGFVAGFAVGGGVAFALGSAYGLGRKDKLLLALLAGAYCTLPFTSVLPLGTLVGAYLELRRRR